MLAETVDKLSYIDRKLLTYISVLVVALIVCKTLPVSLHNGKVSSRSFGNNLSVSLVCHRPRLLGNLKA